MEKTDKNDHHSVTEVPSPIILSGTNIGGGEGKMLTVMVGEKSSLGMIISKLVVRPESTPLQHKLEKIAGDIGLLGTYVALLTIHVLILRFFIENLNNRGLDLFGVDDDNSAMVLVYLKKLVGYIIIGVAIIVVAVPEGLPLAVMISLAYSIERMLRDANDVKRLASCEIMGGANNICSDKTGTLTLNMMKVTNVWAGKDITIPQNMDKATGEMTKLRWSDFFRSESHSDNIGQGIACNTADKTGATDRAMVELVQRMGVDIGEMRAKYLPGENKIRFPFSSKRKRMSTVLENVPGCAYKRIHIKGASEIVKACCSHYLNADGSVVEITDEITSHLDNVIETYAK